MEAELAKALVAASAELRNPVFDRMNPHLKSKYASLAAVRDAVVPVLAKHGLAVIQDLISEDNRVGVINTLIHSSGQTTISPTFYIPVDKATAQGYGAAVTYARRYSLQALVNVVGDEDDDGETEKKNLPKVDPEAEIRAILAAEDPAEKKRLYKAAIDKCSATDDVETAKKIREGVKANDRAGE